MRQTSTGTGLPQASTCGASQKLAPRAHGEMMDYFTRLAQQALDGASAAVRPRLPGRFEPGGVPEQVPGALQQSDARAPEAPARPSLRSAAPQPAPAPHELASAIMPAAEPHTAASATNAPMPTVEVRAGAPQPAPFEQPPGAGRHSSSVAPSAAATISTADAPDQAISTAQIGHPPAAGSAASSSRRAAVAPALAAPAAVLARTQADTAAPPPVIRVNIRRVEVRAVLRPAAPAPRPAAAAQPAAAPLEDYLRADKGGRTR